MQLPNLTQAGAAPSDSRRSPAWPLIVIGLPLAWMCAGCGQTEAIRHYRVPKETVTEKSASGGREATAPATAPPTAPATASTAAPASEQRMLAAIVLRADTAWFFKATGPDAPVAGQASAFRALLRSVRFVDEKPQWTLPEGWRQKAGSRTRFATLAFGPEDAPVELTVTRFEVFGDPAAFVSSNVNRWRKQMQLPPIEAGEFDKQSEKFDLDGAVATVVDIHGLVPDAGVSGGEASVPGGARSPKAAQKKVGS